MAFNQVGSSYGCGSSPAPLYGGQRKLENPYVDFATKFVPRSFADVIDWSEHVSMLSDDVGTGIRKLYTYFCTPIDVGALELTGKEYEIQNSLKWDVLLKQKIDYLGHCTQLGLNVGVYGNDFVSVTLKHQRMLQCPDCLTMIPVNAVGDFPDMEFRFADMAFTGYCPKKKCSKHTNRARFEMQHNYDRKPENLVIKHWPIRELDFDYMEATDELRPYWRIPNRIRRKVIDEQDPDSLHDLDMGVLEAICENKLLQFDDRVMFHGKEPHLSGLENRGLGIPRTLSLARQAWLVQLLKKQCQALSSKYVTPMEFFSLGQGASSGMGAMDAVQSVDAKMFRNYIEEMIYAHSQDPTRSYVVPFQVQHQYAGGGADQFVPTTLLQLATQDLSNSLVPAPMLRGDLDAQAAPMFLRTFEAFNREIPSMYNRFLWFMVARVSELLRVAPIGCVHQSAAIADNIGVDSMLMESAAMGKSSDYAWMRRVGLNPQTEISRRLAEARQQLEFEAKLLQMQKEGQFKDVIEARASEAMIAAAEGGQGAEGGDPSQGGGGMPAPNATLLPSQGYSPPQDIAEMETAAVEIASMLGTLQQAQRNQELSVLRTNQPAFHKMVIAELDNLRDQVASEGRAQLAPTL